jgi:hypothetical protein
MRDRGIKKMLGTSELEGVVLGHLWKRGPCTTYSIRKELLQSPSSHWSASAGAIYPLLARFEERGLVRSRKAMHKNREGWRYSLTARHSPGRSSRLPPIRCARGSISWVLSRTKSALPSSHRPGLC